ncbi:MAG: winged helix-turn-helix domain-containing protein [Gemmatimonadota bacterium]
MTERARAVELIGERDRAELLLHPLRLRILEQARDEALSAAEVARRIGETPQKVNYHVGALADAGFLRLAEERRRGNLVERRYRATARRYAFSPAVLGPLGLESGPVSAGEALSAARLLGLTALVQEELGATLREAAEADIAEVPTLSIDAEVRFSSATERAAFADELREAVLEVVGRYTGGGDRGWPFRLALGCYPLPSSGGPESTELG